MENEKIVIKMLKTVTSDIPFLCKPNTIALEGREYKAKSNRYEAVSVR